MLRQLLTAAGVVATFGTAGFFAWRLFSPAPSSAAAPAPERPEPALLPSQCEGWRPSPPRPEPDPDDFPPEQWARLSCSRDDCIAKSQANAFRFRGGQYVCDFEESMAAKDSVLCSGAEYDSDDNRVREVVISCPATAYGPCEVAEQRDVFVPHRIVTVGDMIEAHVDTCQVQRDRRSICAEWCGGEDPDPGCAPFWNVLSSCAELAKYQEQAALLGEDHALFFDRPD